jgi:hypothetical protein
LLQHNSFRLLTTLLLCASTSLLHSQQRNVNQITVEDLSKDLVYIDKFLTTVKEMDSTLLPEEMELINHDLYCIDHYIEQLSENHDRSDLQIQMEAVKKIFNQRVAYENKLQKEEEEENKPKHTVFKKETSIIAKKTASRFIKKKQTRKQSSTTQPKKNKKNNLKEFSAYLSSSSSSSHQPIKQPQEIEIKPYQDPRIVQLKDDIKKRQETHKENIAANSSSATGNRTDIFIANLTDQTISIEYIPKNGTRALKQEIAPRQTSRAIDKNNIKTLFCRKKGSSSASAMDLSIITQETTIKVRSQTRSFGLLNQTLSFELEKLAASAQD